MGKWPKPRRALVYRAKCETCGNGWVYVSSERVADKALAALARKDGWQMDDDSYGARCPKCQAREKEVKA